MVRSVWIKSNTEQASKSETEQQSKSSKNIYTRFNFHTKHGGERRKSIFINLQKHTKSRGDGKWIIHEDILWI